jgi:hypothetical protein
MAEVGNHLPQVTAATDTRPAMYNKNIGSKLGDPARRLLETYSKVPADEVENHVYEIV